MMESVLSSSSSPPSSSKSSPFSDESLPSSQPMIFEEIAEVFKLPPQNDEYIAIIGGLGYIGSHTSLELIKSGYNILIIDNLSNAYRGVFDRLKLLAKRSYKTKQRQAPEMHFHEADYRDEVIMRKLLDGYRKTPKLDLFQMNDIDQSSKIIGVIHFGGYKSVQESIRFPLKYYANNVAGVVDLCSLLDEYHIRTLIFSSFTDLSQTWECHSRKSTALTRRKHSLTMMDPQRQPSQAAPVSRIHMGDLNGCVKPSWQIWHWPTLDGQSLPCGTLTLWAATSPESWAKIHVESQQI